MPIKQQKIDLKQVKLNTANPRAIKEHKLRLLMERMIVFPKMLNLRPVVVDKSMTILGGNMRVRALQLVAQKSIEEIRALASKTKNFQRLAAPEQEKLIQGWQVWLDKPTVEVAFADDLTDEEKQEFIIADNASFGEWDYDMLANEWEADDLASWGVDVWQQDEINIDDFFEQHTGETEEKEEVTKFTVTIPTEQVDNIDEVRDLIRSALTDFPSARIN